MERTVTYSASICIPLSRECANLCGYCGFVEPGDGLVSTAKMEALIRRGALQDASEALLMSGEGLDGNALVMDKLAERNYSSLTEFAADAARRALKRGLLPHTNIGVLDEEELSVLKPVNASMGLMLENVNEAFGRRVHPGKSIRQRLETIAAAGRLEIPFTTGILVGLGESQADRLESLEVLAALSETYDHIQEIIIQNYVPNRRSTIARLRLGLAEYEELISVSRSLMPAVPVQVPPNLNPNWLDCVRFGARDLGGISTQADLVNPGRPWRPAAWYGRLLEAAGYRLLRRLPVYERFIRRGWFSPAVGEVLLHAKRSLAS
jgi:FO synthase subunit 1